MIPLSGAVAVVTGGASGIGLGLVRALAAAGACVILADRSAERAVEAAAAVTGTVIPKTLDVTDQNAVKALVAEVVANHGRLDYLFNNAGVGLAGDVRDLTPADWQTVMDVNVWGVIHGTLAAYEVMVRQGRGHIVNIASGAGLGPRPGMVPYAASKHAVVGLSTSLRLEAKPLGIQVNVVCPGSVATNILNATPYRNLDGGKLTAGIPVPMISAEECARRILKGLRRDRPIIPVTAIAWIEWLALRYVPPIAYWLAGQRQKRFAANRIVP